MEGHGLTGKRKGRLSGYQQKRIRFALDHPETVLESEPRPLKRVPEAPRGLLPPGLYQKGYGGVEYYPFSIRKAVSEAGYRRGILRAMKNPAYNTTWRAEAAYYMEITYDIIFGKRKMIEAIHFSK